jgi:hypothetical protein
VERATCPSRAATCRAVGPRPRHFWHRSKAGLVGVCARRVAGRDGRVVRATQGNPVFRVVAPLTRCSPRCQRTSPPTPSPQTSTVHDIPARSGNRARMPSPTAKWRSADRRHSSGANQAAGEHFCSGNEETSGFLPKAAPEANSENPVYPLLTCISAIYLVSRFLFLQSSSFCHFFPVDISGGGGG